MADDYKEKLKKFIAEIPPMPGAITLGGPNPPPYSEEFKKQLTDPKFSLPTPALFLKYTGTSQTTLVKSWAGGGKLTTCNGFVGICGREMGAKHFLGQFELEDFLKKIGKGHAWIPARTGGKKPGYGDIFRPVSYHMGVSLDFEGDNWNTVEGGQGGSSTGYDIVKRKQQPYNAGSLQGWCDMRLYLDPRPALPDWLIGVWVIYAGDKTYTYHFNEYYEVSEYLWKPIGNPEDADPIDTGTVSQLSFDDFQVTWTTEGGTEKFKYNRWESFPGIMEKMTGTSSRGEPLKGVRL